MFAPGDRVTVLSGENAGRGAEVLRHLQSGRVLVAVDGFITNQGLRMYVPGSLGAEVPPEPTPEPEPAPQPEPTPAPEPEPPPTERTASGPIEITTSGRTVADTDVSGNVIVQDEVRDTTLRRVSILDGTVGLMFATALAPVPPVRNTRVSEVKVARMSKTGMNLRNFDGCFIDRADVSEVFKTDPAQHTDGIRTYGGGRNLQIRDAAVHDMGAIGFFIKDGAVDWVRLERLRVWNIVGAFQAVQLYQATNVAFIDCDLGGRTLHCNRGCSVYVDEATRATCKLADNDGTTTWLARDPWLDPAAPALAWVG